MRRPDLVHGKRTNLPTSFVFWQRQARIMPGGDHEHVNAEALINVIDFIDVEYEYSHLYHGGLTGWVRSFIHHVTICRFHILCAGSCTEQRKNQQQADSSHSVIANIHERIMQQGGRAATRLQQYFHFDSIRE
jgi:hypothetical protein